MSVEGTPTVTYCGRLYFDRRKVNYLGYFDDETCRLEPIDDPFGLRAPDAARLR